MRSRRPLGAFVTHKFGLNPRPTMLPVEFGAAELALYALHREWPDRKTTDFPLAVRPYRTAFEFPWLQDRDRAGTNLRFYTQVFSKAGFARLLAEYHKIAERIFDIADDQPPVVRDEALLRARGPEYDRLLSEVPSHTDQSFADQDVIDSALGDGADLIVHVHDRRPALNAANDDSERFHWRARLPRSAWNSPVRPSIKAGPKAGRTLCLDSLAAYASPDEQEVLAQAGFLLPDGSRSRAVRLADTAHIAAMVNVGKSTLARALARQVADQGGRTLFLVASTAEGFQLARRLRRAGDLKTTVLIGQSDEARHLKNRERADRTGDDFSVYLEDDWETIGRGCPLEALAVAETGHDGLPERESYRPCDGLFIETRTKAGKPGFGRTVCGFAESCPSVERYRRLRNADVIICTVPTFVHSSIPEWIDPRGLRISEFAYEYCSLVIADEADALQRQFEDVFYSHWTLTGQADAIGPRAAARVARHLSEGHRDRRPGVADFINFSGRLAGSADRLIETCRRGGLNALFGRFLFPQDFASRVFDLIDPLPSAPPKTLETDLDMMNAVAARQAMRHAFLLEISYCGSRQSSGQAVENTAALWSDPADVSFTWPEEVRKAVEGCYLAAISGGDLKDETADLLDALLRAIGDRAAFRPGSAMRELEAAKDKRFEAWHLLQAAFHADYLTRVATFFTAGSSPFHQEAIGEGEFDLPAPMYRSYAPMVLSGPIYGLRIVQSEPSLRATMRLQGRSSPAFTVELIALDFIGRTMLTDFHDYFEPHLGRGPICLLLSGTSVNPQSSEFHVRRPFTALMVNRTAGTGTIGESRGHYLPLFYPPDKRGERQPIKFSGTPPANRKIIVEAAAEALHRDGAWSRIAALCPPGRERALVYFHRVEDAAVFIKHLVETGMCSAEEAAFVRGSTVTIADEFGSLAVSRSELEDPAVLLPLKILAAARGSVNRGLNMMIDDASAFGALIFLPAPHPVPSDVGLAVAWAMAGSLVAYDRDVGASGDPIKWLEREGKVLCRGFLERSLPYRRRQASEELRADEIAGQAAELNQAIGRGLRGNKSIEVFFVDPQFKPLLAEINAVLEGGISDGIDRAAFDWCFVPTRTVIRTFLEDLARQGEEVRQYGGRR